MWKCCIVSILAMAGSALGQPMLGAPDLPESVTAGEPFTVVYAVTWAGEPDAYRLHPPALDPEDGVEARVIRAEARAEDGLNHTDFLVEYRIAEPGETKLPALQIPWQEASEEAVESDAPLVTLPALRPEKAEVTALPPRANTSVYLWVIPVVVVVAAASAVVWRLRRRAPEEAGHSPLEAVQEELHAAQRHRLDGDHYQFYQALGRVLAVVATDDESKRLRERIERRVRAVGYQGYAPSDDDLTGDARDTERAVARWREVSAP